MAEARDFKFCIVLGHMKYYHMDDIQPLCWVRHMILY